MEILWKGTVTAKFQANHLTPCKNCAFPQNFHAMKLSEITVFYAVTPEDSQIKEITRTAQSGMELACLFRIGWYLETNKNTFKEFEFIGFATKSWKIMRFPRKVTSKKVILNYGLFIIMDSFLVSTNKLHCFQGLMLLWRSVSQVALQFAFNVYSQQNTQYFHSLTGSFLNFCQSYLYLNKFQNTISRIRLDTRLVSRRLVYNFKRSFFSSSLF